MLPERAHLLRNACRVLLVTLPLLLLGAPLGAAAQEDPRRCVAGVCVESMPDTNRWLIAPYLWAPSIKGEVELSVTSAKFDYGADELASGINAGAMGFVIWDRGQDFFYAEGLGFRYEDRLSVLQDKLINAEIAMVELGYGRRYCISRATSEGGCRLSLSPYMGLRQTQMDISVKLNEGGLESVLLELMGLPDTLTAKERWLDPALGVIAQWQLSKQWFLYSKLDAAGFGLGYNDYWNAMGVVQYQFTERWGVATGYRFADFDAEPGGGNDLRMELRGDGPLLGILFSF